MVLNASAFVHTSALAQGGTDGVFGWRTRSNSLANAVGIFFCSSLFQYTSVPLTDGLTRRRMLCSELKCACVVDGVAVEELGEVEVMQLIVGDRLVVQRRRDPVGHDPAPCVHA